MRAGRAESEGRRKRFAELSPTAIANTPNATGMLAGFVTMSNTTPIATPVLINGSVRTSGGGTSLGAG